MNRTHLEGAAEALAAQQGYAFHTGPEDGMAHTMRSYPAAWLAPLELHAVEAHRSMSHAHSHQSWHRRG